MKDLSAKKPKKEKKSLDISELSETTQIETDITSVEPNDSQEFQ